MADAHEKPSPPRDITAAVEEALRAGELGLEAFMATSGLDREEALRELERRKQAGRVPSEAMGTPE